MELAISPSALQIFRQDWGYGDGDSIRIFVRYVSGGPEPYGFGIMKDEPMDPAAVFRDERLIFYIESKDIWFLDSHTLTVGERNGDIVFSVGG